MITIDEIRKNIQEGIKTSGMTQTDIAKNLNIYQSAVQQYLSGRSLPALDTLANLCVLLDLDANEILCISRASKSINVKDSFNNNSGNINFKVNN